MLSNYIGGGQVFLHKLRMFTQVFGRSVTVSFVVGVLIGGVIFAPSLKKQDLSAAISYQKAILANEFDTVLNPFRISVLGKKTAHITVVNASTIYGIYGYDMDPQKVISHKLFRNSYDVVRGIIVDMIKVGMAATFTIFVLIFLVWWKFGKILRSDQTLGDRGAVLTADQVSRKLNSLGKAGDLRIGNMPLVKDMETRHFLVTGSTGSGKTNLIHNILPQIEQKKQPVIVIDQTGEMIAKYYNKDRGDIIFNPFDARSHNWDFWSDCSSKEESERFSKILIGFNRKQSNSYSDPFWENSAETVFNACVEHLRPTNRSLESLIDLVCRSDLKYLKTVLAKSEAERYLGEGSKQTAFSILSVLAANAKPLTYLTSAYDRPSFSMKQYFVDLKNGSDAWLFLATKPSSRGLTLPLISCLTELALFSLMEIGISEQRRVWFILDELASLGKLPSLSSIMTEGRKYGACVIAGAQSLNQLYESYGHYGGSIIFGQFGTSFFFRNTESAIAKMLSDMCGQQTIIRQQKNTSFGANEFRDGVSYTEQHQKKPLVDPEDLSRLSVGECYVLMPEVSVRLAKIQTQEARGKQKNEGFVPLKKHARLPELEMDQIALDLQQSAALAREGSKAKDPTRAISRTHQDFELDTKKQGTELMLNL